MAEHARAKEVLAGIADDPMEYLHQAGAGGHFTEDVRTVLAFVRALEAERDELRSGLIEAGAIKDENERLRDALTPSADTKAAYMGEFRLGVRLSHPYGGEDYRSIDVPWTTIKEIMGAIRARAALSGGGDGG